MDGQQQRGRSPSAGHPNHLRHTPSPSPHGAFPSTVPPTSTGLGLDQSLVSDTNQYNQSFNDPLTSTSHNSFDPNDFLNPSQSQQDHFAPPAENSFLHAQTLSQSAHHSPLLDQSANNGFTPHFLDTADHASLSFGNDPQLFDSSEYLDPQLLGGDQQQSQSIDPNDLMNQMATHQHSPTPPHMLMSRHSSASPHVSPGLPQGQFAQSHSRHTSLDPSSAALGFNPGWGEGQQFRGHRRSPSDAHSEVSSNFNSPYLGTADAFGDSLEHHSPLLNPQPDPSMFQGQMSLEAFSINDQPQQPPHISPIPSPHHSPRVDAQQMPQFPSDNGFGLSAPHMPSQFGSMSQGGGATMYQAQEAFPTSNQAGQGPPGAISPPEIPDINIMPPPSRQASFEPPKANASEDALSPPDRRSPRPRAVSDPYSGGARSPSPHSNGSHSPQMRTSLSPNSARISRSPSPGRGPGNRRSSTPSVPNRGYILDLADPSRPLGASGESSPGRQRTQKHPATFQCSLCPKRFTRAYNLRSHLRTHTDERPFVCNVCGKAFARQHDRKRHEGLHSGEKRFICRGHLKIGDTWGCGRKFARADALGRHFRSEAGRVCIKPLLEEEAAEKGGLGPEANQQAVAGAAPGMMPGMAVPPGMPVMGMPMEGSVGFGQQPAGVMHYQLPQRLFQQFPMLAGMQWDQLPPGEDMDDISGRSSFDASSGGEMDDHDDQGAAYVGAQGWASDTGGY